MPNTQFRKIQHAPSLDFNRGQIRAEPDSEGGVCFVVGVSRSFDFVFLIVGDFYDAVRDEIGDVKPSNYGTGKCIHLTQPIHDRTEVQLY